MSRRRDVTGRCNNNKNLKITYKIFENFSAKKVSSWMFFFCKKSKISYLDVMYENKLIFIRLYRYIKVQSNKVPSLHSEITTIVKDVGILRILSGSWSIRNVTMKNN